MPFWTKKEPQAPQTTAFDGAWAGTEKFGPVKLASCDLRDGQQSVKPEKFNDIMGKLRAVAAAVGREI
mgnify:CR=1 FL=1